MKKLLLSALYFLLSPFLFAQPLVTSSFTNIEQGVQDVLFDDCVTVTGLTYTGSNSAIGSFSAGFLGWQFNSGLILSTGGIRSAQGPNNEPDEGLDFNLAGDYYLNSLLDDPDYEGHDAAVLRFNIVSQSDTMIGGAFIFGSEEYPEYAGTGFVDILAIFIQGPGIVGMKNIACIPGTNVAININNLNANLNSSFYVDNSMSSQNEWESGIQWDGYTVPIRFEHAVIPGETYTIRIAIEDVGDGIYDSGLLIAAGSFNCNADNTGIDKYTSRDKITHRTLGDGYFQFEYAFSKKENVSFEVYDLNGKRVISKCSNSQAGTEDIHLENYSQGLYILRITTGGKTKTYKLIR